MKRIRTAYRSRKVASRHHVPGLGGDASAPAVNNKCADSVGIVLPPLDLQGGGSGHATASPASAAVLESLSDALGGVTAATHPRTYRLLHSGGRRLARKLIEEACEVTVEAVKRDLDGVVRESADLLYHLVVLWFRIGIPPVEVWQEMQRRADMLGIAEKLPKPFDDDGPSTDFHR